MTAARMDGHIKVGCDDAIARAKKVWDRVVADATTGCWNWTGEFDISGYGRFYTSGRRIGAHRLSFELQNGPIPFWAEIDHLCHNPACINPDHLEAVSRRENCRRRRRRATRTHCPQGHEYLSETTMIHATTKSRVCLICNRERCRADYWRRKGINPETSVGAPLGNLDVLKTNLSHG